VFENRLEQRRIVASLPLDRAGATAITDRRYKPSRSENVAFWVHGLTKKVGLGVGLAFCFAAALGLAIGGRLLALLLVQSGGEFFGVALVVEGEQAASAWAG